jgi:hypothetical protein
VQHHVHVADGLGRQPGSATADRLAAATLQQVGIQVVELDRGEGLFLPGVPKVSNRLLCGVGRHDSSAQL